MLLKFIIGVSKAFVLGKEISFNDESDTGSIPSGVIVMWSGTSSNIPAGWLLCDGSNGTPDLRDRFIVGAGSTYSRGDTGGSNSVTLTTAQMPSHRHTIEIRRSGSVFYPVSMYGKSGSGSNDAIQWGVWEDRIDTMSSTGSDEPHENRPPYYALCFIMKS